MIETHNKAQLLSLPKMDSKISQINLVKWTEMDIKPPTDCCQTNSLDQCS